MKKAVVTGNVASGKSAVCSLLEELGACSLSADRIVHKLYSQNPEIQQKICEIFALETFLGTPRERALLAEKAFQNPALLQQLEQLTHPLVREEMDKRLAEEEQKGTALVAIEIPLFFESKKRFAADAILFVDTPEPLCRERSLLSTEDFTRRLKRQKTPEEKRTSAHFVITNDGDLSSLRAQVQQVYPLLTQPHSA